MGLHARKFSIELPTVDDTASAYKVIERGYADIDAGTRADLLLNLQTGLPLSITIPGTGLSLSMLKKRLTLSVPGPDWVEYEIEYQEPVTTGISFNGVVEAVRDAIGPSPAQAHITLTGATIPTPIYNLGVAVSVTHRGGTIFKGWVTDIAKSSSTGQSGTCVMTAHDIRWFWNGIFVGGRFPVSATYKADDFLDCTFNERGLPDKKSGALLFARGSASATMWTYGQAIKALLTWYNYEGLWTVSDSFINALPHTATVMPETSLAGQTLVSAVDQLVNAGEKVSWRINFSTNPVSLEAVTASSGTSRTLSYRTGTIDTNYSTECNIQESISGNYKSAEIQSAKVIMESHYIDTDFIKETAGGLDFALVFKLNAASVSARMTTLGWTGTAQVSGDICPRIATELVTKWKYDAAETAWTAAEMNDPTSGDLRLLTNAMPWGEFIWVSLDDGVTYKWMTDGFMIDRETSRVFVGNMGGAGNKPEVGLMTRLSTNDVYELKAIDDLTKVKIKATLAIEMPWRESAYGNFTGFSWTHTRYRTIKLDQMRAEGRVATRIRDPANNYLPGSELATAGEAYIDPETKLTNYKTQILNQTPGTLITAGVTAPFAPLLYPGDRLHVNNFSAWPSEIIYITNLQYKMEKGKYTATVSGSNQFWQENLQIATNPNIAWQIAREIQARFQYGYKSK